MTLLPGRRCNGCWREGGCRQQASPRGVNPSLGNAEADDPGEARARSWAPVLREQELPGLMPWHVAFIMTPQYAT